MINSNKENDQNFFEGRCDDVKIKNFFSKSELYKLKNITKFKHTDWLSGRIAAKRAIKSLVFSKKGELVSLKNIIIENKVSGSPYVLGIEDIEVSIAHKEGVGVAKACYKNFVGIDIEKIQNFSKNLIKKVLSSEEISLLPEISNNWITRAWCAKEAFVKMKNTGLRGYPSRIKIQSIFNDFLIIDEFLIKTREKNGLVVAWTLNKELD